MLVHFRAASVKFLNVWMIVGLGQHTRDHAPLLGHAHAFGGAKRLDVLSLDIALARGSHVNISLDTGFFTASLRIILAASGTCPPRAQTRSRRKISAVAAIAPGPG